MIGDPNRGRLGTCLSAPIWSKILTVVDLINVFECVCHSVAIVIADHEAVILYQELKDAPPGATEWLVE